MLGAKRSGLPKKLLIDAGRSPGQEGWTGSGQACGTLAAWSREHFAEMLAEASRQTSVTSGQIQELAQSSQLAGLALQRASIECVRQLLQITGRPEPTETVPDVLRF